MVQDFPTDKPPKSGTALKGHRESLVHDKLIGGEEVIIYLSTMGNPVILNTFIKKCVTPYNMLRRCWYRETVGDMKAFMKSRSNGCLKQDLDPLVNARLFQETLEMIKVVAQPKNEAHISSNSDEITHIW